MHNSLICFAFDFIYLDYILVLFAYAFLLLLTSRQLAKQSAYVYANADAIELLMLILRTCKNYFNFNIRKRHHISTILQRTLSPQLNNTISTRLFQNDKKKMLSCFIDLANWKISTTYKKEIIDKLVSKSKPTNQSRQTLTMQWSLTETGIFTTELYLPLAKRRVKILKDCKQH